MREEPKRLKLSADQVALINDALAESEPEVKAAAAKIANGVVVPDEQAETVVSALADAMLGDEGFHGEGLTRRRIQIDDVVGIVQQMAEHFCD